MELSHRTPDYESGALPTELLIAVHNLAHRSGIEPLALCSTGRRSSTELTMHYFGGKGAIRTHVTIAYACLRFKRSALNHSATFPYHWSRELELNQRWAVLRTAALPLGHRDKSGVPGRI